MADPISKVDELGAMLNRHGLVSIRWEDGDMSVEVRRDAPSPPAGSTYAAVPLSVSGATAGQTVPSPMTGVFYRKPLPSEPEFVKEGERVAAGQVIGMIEAMKVFSEVECPLAGTLTEFLVRDGGLVHEGEPLFVLES